MAAENGQGWPITLFLSIYSCTSYFIFGSTSSLSQCLANLACDWQGHRLLDTKFQQRLARNLELLSFLEAATAVPVAAPAAAPIPAPFPPPAMPPISAPKPAPPTISAFGISLDNCGPQKLRATKILGHVFLNQLAWSAADRSLCAPRLRQASHALTHPAEHWKGKA